MRLADAMPLLSDHDRNAVVSFQRFLALGVAPDDAGRIPREFPGWVPYCLGTGPEPPEGYDAVPITAWTVPS